MKTLADFKRALIVGSKWKTYNHLCGDLGVGEVIKVRSKDLIFERIGKNGEKKISYFEFPKASDFEVDNEGNVNIYWDYCGNRELILTYTKI